MVAETQITVSSTNSEVNNIKKPGEQQKKADYESLNKDSIAPRNIDKLLTSEVGPLGPWQFMILIVGLFSIPPFEIFSVYANTIPLHRCRMPDSIERQLSTLNFSEAISVIQGNNASQEVKAKTGCYHQLDLSSYDNHSYTWSGQLQPCNLGYIYAPREWQYPYSTVQSFDLVCERSWLAPFTTSMFMLGMLLGFYTGGWSGDRYGRRLTALIFSLIQYFVCVIVSIAPWEWLLIVGRFFQGATCTGILVVVYLMLFEVTIARWRSVVCTCATMLQGVVLRALAALLAYLIPNWRWLNIGLSASGLFGLVYYWLVPESPRWLLSQRRYSETINTLERGYRWNHFGKRAPCGTFDDVWLHAKRVPKATTDESIASSNDSSNWWCKCLQLIKPTSLIQFFTTPMLFKRLSFGSVVFLCHVFSYYGMVLYVGEMRGVVYTVALIGALMSLPGTLLSGFLYRYFHWRKKPLLVIFVLAGFTTLFGSVYTMVLKPEVDTVLKASAYLSITLFETAFDMLYVYIPELYPTSVRSKGFGYASAFARFGCAMCSFVNKSGQSMGHGSPLAFYSAAAFLAAFTLCFLPDTKGENLEDTLDEIVEDAELKDMTKTLTGDNETSRV